MTLRVVIFAGADIQDPAWLRGQISCDDVMICADSGARHAKALSLTPDLIIGDFDSIAPELLSFYQGQCTIIHDDDENSTDLMKALHYAHKHYPDAPIDIYGAVGQRADHDFSNYLILKSMTTASHIRLMSKGEWQCVAHQSPFSFSGVAGSKIGIFPLDPVTNMTFKGVKYAPECLNSPYIFGWNGACNEMVKDTASITFDTGCLLITYSEE